MDKLEAMARVVVSAGMAEAVTVSEFKNDPQVLGLLATFSNLEPDGREELLAELISLSKGSVAKLEEAEKVLREFK